MVIKLTQMLTQMTVNLGQGGNCAIEGAASLANALNALITSCRGEKPTMADIDSVLRSYQSSQKPRIKSIAKAAWDLTRVQYFEHPKTWLFLASTFSFVDPIKQAGINMYLDTHTINYLPQCCVEYVEWCLRLDQSNLGVSLLFDSVQSLDQRIEVEVPLFSLTKNSYPPSFPFLSKHFMLIKHRWYQNSTIRSMNFPPRFRDVPQRELPHHHAQRLHPKDSAAEMPKTCAKCKTRNFTRRTRRNGRDMSLIRSHLKPFSIPSL